MHDGLLAHGHALPVLKRYLSACSAAEEEAATMIIVAVAVAVT